MQSQKKKETMTLIPSLIGTNFTTFFRVYIYLRLYPHRHNSIKYKGRDCLKSKLAKSFCPLFLNLMYIETFSQRDYTRIPRLYLLKCKFPRYKINLPTVTSRELNWVDGLHSEMKVKRCTIS